MNTLWKRISTVAAMTFALSLLAGTALAQDAPRVKEINFEDDTVMGDLLLPTGDRTTSRAGDGVTSLVKSRTDFVSELLKSVENLSM